MLPGSGFAAVVGCVYYACAEAAAEVKDPEPIVTLPEQEPVTPEVLESQPIVTEGTEPQPIVAEPVEHGQVEPEPTQDVQVVQVCEVKEETVIHSPGEYCLVPDLNTFKPSCMTSLLHSRFSQMVIQMRFLIQVCLNLT